MASRTLHTRYHRNGHARMRILNYNYDASSWATTRSIASDLRIMGSCRFVASWSHSSFNIRLGKWLALGNYNFISNNLKILIVVLMASAIIVTGFPDFHENYYYYYDISWPHVRQESLQLQIRKLTLKPSHRKIVHVCHRSILLYLCFTINYY